MIQSLSRRSFLKKGGCCSALAAFAPRLSFAAGRAQQQSRYIVIILRGAMDGLGAVPPIGDPDLYKIRGSLVPAAAKLYNLDGFFGLHPALSTLYGLYRQKQAMIFHAYHTPYRARSHFDGQDILETGGRIIGEQTDGWLNRSLAFLGEADQRLGLASAVKVPLLLQGEKLISSWAPSELPEISSDFASFAEKLYQDDPLLEAAFSDLQSLKQLSSAQLRSRGNAREPQSLAFARTIAALLRQEQGAKVAVMEMTGWDTHSQQGRETGRLANSLRELDQVFSILRSGLSGVWSNTVISVVTEFGRTVAPNGSGGTDHGMATASFLLGGAVRGGQVLSRWPGLSSGALYEDRDLFPTADIRSVFKSVFMDHLQLDRDAVESIIFPNSSEVPALSGLLL